MFVSGIAVETCSYLYVASSIMWHIQLPGLRGIYTGPIERESKEGREGGREGKLNKLYIIVHMK